MKKKIIPTYSFMPEGDSGFAAPELYDLLSTI